MNDKAKHPVSDRLSLWHISNYRKAELRKKIRYKHKMQGEIKINKQADIKIQ